MGYNISRGPFEKTAVLAQEAPPTAKTEEDSGEGKAAALKDKINNTYYCCLCLIYCPILLSERILELRATVCLDI